MKQIISKMIVTILLLSMVHSLFCVCALAADLHTGDIVTFGEYEQDDIYMNGPEPIEWYVLYVDDESALLISRYCLFSAPFYESWAALAWDESMLRSYLNDEFLHDAFSADEQSVILPGFVPKETNPVYRTGGGDDTEDMVFILGNSEAERFLRTDKLLKGIPTDYCVSDGARLSGEGTCWYWLRTPGKDQTMATYVTTEVKISIQGIPLYYSDGGVRPCIWIDLSQIQ